MQIFDINRRQPSKTGPKELWTTWPLATRAGATAGDWRKALHASTSSSWVHDSVPTLPELCNIPSKKQQNQYKSLEHPYMSESH